MISMFLSDKNASIRKTKMNLINSNTISQEQRINISDTKIRDLEKENICHEENIKVEVTQIT